MSGKEADIGMISMSFRRCFLFVLGPTGSITECHRTNRHCKDRKKGQLDKQNDNEIDLIHIGVIKNIGKVKQNKKVIRMCWCSYMSESAIDEADLADSPDAYCNHRGEGHSPTQSAYT